MLTKREQLKDRIDATIKKLEYRFSELKADTRSTAADERDKIAKKLSEAKEYIKEGWDNMTEAVAAKLDSWLDSDGEKKDVTREATATADLPQGKRKNAGGR